MDVAIILAIISLLGNAIQYYLSYRKDRQSEELEKERDKKTGEDTLREDLFLLIDQQNKKIDSLNGLIDKQWQQIDTLKEQRGELKTTADKQTIQIEELQEQRNRIRSEFTEVVKKSENQVNNWRESYYLAMDQYNKLKTENYAIKKELEELKISHKQLLEKYNHAPLTYS